jgi:methylation protein EvaC
MKRKFLDLGKQPITNAFLTADEFDNEYFYNLSMGIDEDTKLVSLMETVKPEMMFNEIYAHRASMSKTMRDSFKVVAESLKEQFGPSNTLEIGSNDGVFIRNFGKNEVVAIEPCQNLADITSKMGYKTYSRFWDTSTAQTIVADHGNFDVIYSANTISHIENLAEVFNAVDHALTDGGVFVFEDPSLYNVLNNTSYDQFYDEHAHVFSVIALNSILNDCGLEIFRVDNLTTHGGSNRIYVKKKVNTSLSVDESVHQNIKKESNCGMEDIFIYEIFANRIQDSKSQLVELLNKLKNDGKKIISYGATYKSATIFNYCGIGPDLFDCIIDTTPNKQGKFSPGMHIPIISPEEGFNGSVDYAFLGAWNFTKEIMAKEQSYIDRGGRFITHVPSVRLI